MEIIKKHFINLAIGLFIFFNLAFSFTCYSQTKITANKKCIIVSDIHFDPLYGSKKDSALKRKLIAASFDEWKRHFENSAPQMKLDASLLFKDANYAVLKSALANMKKQLPHPAFIIIAGDFIWHNATPADSTLKKKTIQFIARLFKESFPDAAMIPAMGNNDTYGNDYQLQDPKFLSDFAEAWEPNFLKPAAHQLKAQGYYTREYDNLTLIVINSALLSYGSNYPQAATMFKWLQTNLAKPDHKNVWIISHIPPGLNPYNGSVFWNADYTQTFVNDVVKYSQKVKFCIASHTHFNDFKVFYTAAANAEPVAFMRIVPSICDNHGNNPSFEIAEFSNTTGRVINETNYYLNLAAVPKNNSNAQTWTGRLATSTLIQGPINARNFSKLIDHIKSDQTGQTLGNYVNFYSVGTSSDSSLIFNRHNYLKYLKADSLKGK
jgi:sphingomyelin phosphodiesterase acid-like 3